MTTHLFSNTFCKLEILFKLQRLKNERKEGQNEGGGLGSGGGGAGAGGWGVGGVHQFTSKECNLFNQQHK